MKYILFYIISLSLAVTGLILHNWPLLAFSTLTNAYVGLMKEVDRDE